MCQESVPNTMCQVLGTKDTMRGKFRAIAHNALMKGGKEATDQYEKHLFLMLLGPDKKHMQTNKRLVFFTLTTNKLVRNYMPQKQRKFSLIMPKP